MLGNKPSKDGIFFSQMYFGLKLRMTEGSSCKCSKAHNVAHFHCLLSGVAGH